MSSVTADRFDTARLRAAVLDSWRSSPTRFREDANVEEDYALGAYHDRLVIELAQNAADAARAAGVPGRLHLRVDDECLTAANVGAPLDRSGVESLAAMRASSKSAGSVGRFGVGFAAVLAVSDAPEVRSRAGGVRFDRSATAQLLRDDAGLTSLAQEREPPALRIPFPVDTAPPDGFDTAVVLPWRDATARERGLASVRAIDEVLLLSLPHLAEVIVEIASNGSVDRHTWVADRSTQPWQIRHDDQTSWWSWKGINGSLDEQQAASLPHEEAQRQQWSASVALPVTEDGIPLPLPDALPRVVYAPTPTDEPWGLPVVAIADFRLDPSRRHIAEGSRTDAVVDALTDVYVTLVTEVAGEHGVAALTLVPPAALVGPIDHRVRDGVRKKLTSLRWVPRASDGELEKPSGLVALQPSDPSLVRALAEFVSDLADPEWVGDALRALGLTTRPLHEVWDTLAPLAIAPDQWRSIYDEAQRLDARSLEGLPVPLTDGRVLRGARTTMLAGAHGSDLALLGVNVVHGDAEHPLLERLGSRHLDVRAVFDEALVRRVEDAASFDPVEARQMIVAAVTLLSSLTSLTDSGAAPGELIALARLPVPTADGGWAPAASVVLPGSLLDAVATSDALRLSDDLVASAPPAAWAALGVLTKLTAVTLAEVPLDPDAWDDLLVDGADWCGAAADRAGSNDPAELLAAEVTIVRGLELVEGVPLGALAELLADPDVRRAMVVPTRVLTADGRRIDMRPPAAWWLSETPLLEGRSPVEVRIPGDERIAPFFPVVEPPDGIDLDLLIAIGVHTTLERWLQSPDGPNELLDALVDSDTDTDIGPELLSALYAQLALTATPELVDPPNRLRAVIGGKAAVTGADDVVVAIAPHHALVLRRPHITGTVALAEVLDLDISDDAACAASSVVGTGTPRPVPLIAGFATGPSTYREHDELVVGDEVVDWWVTDGGEVHAATLDGLARGLAWVSGQWSRRFELAASLERPESSAAFTVERLYDR